MDISRRRFIQLTAAGAAAVALPSFAKAVPILYGDMEHDDWDAFKALLDGQLIDDRTPLGVVTITGSKIRITGGHFYFDMTKAGREALIAVPGPHFEHVAIVGNQFSVDRTCPTLVDLI